MAKAKYRSLAARRLALATAIFVMTSAGAGVYAATEHWNDASTSADSSWEQWKTDWEEIQDDYEKISLTPGENESQLNFAWYSHREEIPKVRVSKTKNGLKNAKAFEGTQEETTVAYSAALEETEKDGASYKSNKVTVKGLAENTTYYYQVYQNGKWQSVQKYKVNDFDSYSVMYVADPQIGACKGQAAEEDGTKLADSSDGTTTLAARNDAYNWDTILDDAAEQHSDLSFMISAGDQVNYSNYEYEYAGYLNPSALLSLPVSTTIGNHDSGTYNYSWHFNNPNTFDINGADQTYIAGHTKAGSDYYYTYGDVLYIVLDTNNYNCATHENVIKKAVSENQDCKWRIVTFHQDIYGSGKDHSDSDGMVLRTQLTPIMDKYDIDIVLQGHDHTYSRSYQLTSDGQEHKSYTSGDSSNKDIAEEFQSENLCYDLTSTAADGNKVVNPEGTVYFEQNSATGSKFYELIANQQNYIAERSQTWTPTYSILTVGENQISVKTYDASTGDILEGSSEYTIVKKEETAEPVKTDISKAQISGIKAKTYTGKALTQSLTVKVAGKTLTKNKDYTVKYSNNKNVGTATVTITGTGNYKGSVKKTFKIKLATPAMTVKAGTKSAAVTWNKVTGASGYKIYTAAKKGGTYKAVKTVTKGATVKATVKNLKKGSCYFKMRAYKKISGKTVYSSYSTVKKVTVK